MTNDTIDNYVEVTHAIARHRHMGPDGEEPRPIVDNPSLHPKANPPEYLRVHVPRKSTMTFKIIDEAHELGLQVGDVWQLDAAYEDEILSFRLEPRGAQSSAVTSRLKACYDALLDEGKYNDAASMTRAIQIVEQRGGDNER